MTEFALGQRWVSHADVELGLGVVVVACIGMVYFFPPHHDTLGPPATEAKDPKQPAAYSHEVGGTITFELLFYHYDELSPL